MKKMLEWRALQKMTKENFVLAKYEIISIHSYTTMLDMQSGKYEKI